MNCHGEIALFFSSFAAVFWLFLPSNAPVMLYGIRYWRFFLSQSNRWTQYLAHPKIRRPKHCLLMFASLVTLDGFHLLLSSQLRNSLDIVNNKRLFIYPYAPLWIAFLSEFYRPFYCFSIFQMWNVEFATQGLKHSWHRTFLTNFKKLILLAHLVKKESVHSNATKEVNQFEKLIKKIGFATSRIAKNILNVV